jgi:hypothetical protein
MSPIVAELSKQHYDKSVDLNTLKNDIQILTSKTPQSPVLNALKQQEQQLTTDIAKIEQQQRDIKNLNTILEQKITEVFNQTQQTLAKMQSIDK